MKSKPNDPFAQTHQGAPEPFLPVLPEAPRLPPS